MLSCHPVVDIDVDAPTYVELIEHQLAAGRPMRGLYPTEVLDDPARLAYVRRWAEAGETVRLLSESLPAVAVFGSEAALVSAGWSGDGGSTGHLLVRAPALVAMVRELFEQYWARGLGLPTTRLDGRATTSGRCSSCCSWASRTRRIARQLGVSLRTVRRRVAMVMDELGAATRFQAGMEAARRGLI